MIKFRVPGIPQPQERPIVLRHKRWAIDPRRSVKAKNLVAMCALNAKQQAKSSILGPDYAGAIKVHLFFMNASKKADCDNLMKLVLDALQGVLYKNDNQVTEWSGEKVQNKTIEAYLEAYTEVSLWTRNGDGLWA